MAAPNREAEASGAAARPRKQQELMFLTAAGAIASRRIPLTGSTALGILNAVVRSSGLKVGKHLCHMLLNVNGHRPSASYTAIGRPHLI